MFNYFVLFCLLVVSAMKTESAIIRVSLHEEVKKYVKPYSTVIYDIDETLTYRDNMFFHPRAKKHKKELKKQLEIQSPVVYQNLNSIFHKDSPMMLMEENIPDLIAEFMAQGARIFACTKRYHGTYGVIDSFEEHTHKLIQELGIKFNFWNNSFFYKKPLRIQLDPQECTSGRSCQAILFNDIYFTDDNQKGPALHALFTSLGFIPQHIVFIDDLYDNLVSVDTTFTSLGIPVTCVHYTKPQPETSFSKKELVNLFTDALKAV